MKFVRGRQNLSVTVYVPYDCFNNCSFCSSKIEYEKPTNSLKTLIWLQKVRNSSISEVVFTGGEPMADIESLKCLVDAVNNKDVYINTSLIRTNFEEFCEFVNDTPCIKGINVSRHGTSYEEDRRLLNDIVDDNKFNKIKKKIRVNVVCPTKLTEDFINSIVNRWDTNLNVTISFRENFNFTTPETLHSLTTNNIKLLNECARYDSRSFCDVCDTINFNHNSALFNGKFRYHRGLATTSIKMGDIIIVNDIIIKPSGQLVYDWDDKCDYIDEMCKQFHIVSVNRAETSNYTKVGIPYTLKQPRINTTTFGYCGSLTSTSRC